MTHGRVTGWGQSIVLLFAGIIAGSWAVEAEQLPGQLQLLPASQEHVKYAGNSLFVSCKTAEVAVGLTWFGPDGGHITQRHGPLRVEPSPYYGDGLRGIDLVLNPISRRQRGRYTCKASVDGAPLQAGFDLVVFKPITFRADQKMQYAAEGSDFILRCDASGDPKPQILWRGMRRKSDIVPENKYEVDEKSGGLMVHDVSREDEGQYRCQASQMSSRESAVDAFIISLKVQYKPEWFGARPDEVYAFRSGAVNLTCQAQAEPPAEFLWYRQDQLMLTGPDYDIIHTNNMSKLRLRATNAGTFGEYLCRAQNQIGSIERRILLKQGEKPGVPQVMLDEAGGTRLQLQILPAQPEVAPPVDGYMAQYKREVDQWQTAASIHFNSGAPYVLNNLHTDTIYQVRVAAHNLAGYGDYSVATRHKTAHVAHQDTSGAVMARLLHQLMVAAILSAVILV